MSKRKAYDAHEDEQATKKIRLAGKVITRNILKFDDYRNYSY